MTQGYPVPTTILNIVVDAVLRAMLMEVRVPQESQDGLEWGTGEQEIMFYSDNGHITGIKSIWVQGNLATIIRILERVGI